MNRFKPIQEKKGFNLDDEMLPKPWSQHNSAQASP